MLSKDCRLYGVGADVRGCAALVDACFGECS